MIRYQLDALGWYQFEGLTQSILKHQAGLRVESWGGRGDWGRDAYSPGPLRFPDPSREEEGPFLFQAKFVENANAAGADPFPRLSQAVGAELRQIKKRVAGPRWRRPQVFCLLTNVALTTDHRDALLSTLTADENIPDDPIMMGGKDLCDVLDDSPNLRLAFPEILGLRDLQGLLSQEVSRATLTRSRFAVDASRELARVFVSTATFRRAWNVLGKHNFVVLDGPPEMGKTAIARMIALGRLTTGWEAIECRVPEDVFSLWDDEARQVFVADDAFGRTEFDPRLGRRWEHDLPSILRKLDPRHCLVWTTRKHILAHALSRLDFTGPATAFPDPGEVVVRADRLTTEEKARILYRHAKAADLSEDDKDLLRDRAEDIVEDPHFTPERIRRFVSGELPRLHSLGDSDALAGAVRQAISDPTESSRKAFSGLSDDYRWILTCLLELDYPSRKALYASVTQRYEGLARPSFERCVDDLLGTFLVERHPLHGREVTAGVGRAQRSAASDRHIPGMSRLVENLRDLVLPERRRSRGPTYRTVIDWLHPTYRDVTIEGLADDLTMQSSFAATTTTTGVSLLLAQRRDDRLPLAFPLLQGPDCWAVLQTRCSVLAGDSAAGIVADLLTILREAQEGDATECVDERRDLLRAVTDAIANRQGRTGWVPTEAVVRQWGRATPLLREHDEVRRLNVKVAVQKGIDTLRAALALDDGRPDPVELRDLIGLSDSIDEWPESLAYSDEKLDAYRQLMLELLDEIRDRIPPDLEDLSPMDCEEIEVDYTELDAAIRAHDDHLWQLGVDVDGVCEELLTFAGWCDEVVSRERHDPMEQFPEYTQQRHSSVGPLTKGRRFDVNTMFEDL